MSRALKTLALLIACAPLAAARTDDGPVSFGVLAASPVAGETQAPAASDERTVDPVIAAPQAPRQEADAPRIVDNRRKWSITPYLWATRVEGTATLNGTDSDFDVPFSDIWDNLDFAGLVHVEGANPENAIFLDAIYLSLTSRGSKSGVNTKVDLDQWIVELGGGLVIDRVTEDTPDGEQETRRLEVIGGGRYYYAYTEATLTGGVSADGHASQDWVDPFVGLRGSIDVAKNLKLTARGDVGGFGVGSEHSWNAVGTLQYRLGKTTDIVVGYRALYYDYRNGNNQLETTMSGPLVGLTFRF